MGDGTRLKLMCTIQECYVGSDKFAFLLHAILHLGATWAHDTMVAWRCIQLNASIILCTYQWQADTFHIPRIAK